MFSFLTRVVKTFLGTSELRSSLVVFDSLSWSYGSDRPTKTIIPEVSIRQNGFGHCWERQRMRWTFGKVVDVEGPKSFAETTLPRDQGVHVNITEMQGRRKQDSTGVSPNSFEEMGEGKVLVTSFRDNRLRALHSYELPTSRGHRGISCCSISVFIRVDCETSTILHYL